MSKINKQRLRASHVKNLRNLLEGKVEQAEVIISVKAFAKELQEMIEKIGRLTNEKLGPVVDQMRQTYGQEVSDAFAANSQQELEGILAALRAAKERLSDSVISISQGQSPGVASDMDSEEFNTSEMSDDGDVYDSNEEMTGSDDGFAGEEPLGRAELAAESKIANLKNQITEMRKALQSARKLKESADRVDIQIYANDSPGRKNVEQIDRYSYNVSAILYISDERNDFECEYPITLVWGRDGFEDILGLDAVDDAYQDIDNKIDYDTASEVCSNEISKAIRNEEVDPPSKPRLGY